MLLDFSDNTALSISTAPPCILIKFTYILDYDELSKKNLKRIFDRGKLLLTNKKLLNYNKKFSQFLMFININYKESYKNMLLNNCYWRLLENIT